MNDLNLLNSKQNSYKELESAIFYKDSQLEDIIDELANEMVDEAAEEKMLQQTIKIQGITEIKQQLKEKYKEELTMKEFGDSFIRAIRVIVEQGQNYLTSDEWMQMTTRMMNSRNILIKNGDASEKLQEFATLNGELIAKIASSKFFEKDYSAAIDLYVFLSELNPQSFDFCQRLGVIYQSCQDFKKAIQAYQAALVINPEDISTHLFLAECFCQLQQKDQAKEEREIIQMLIDKTHTQEIWDEHCKALEKVIDML